MGLDGPVSAEEFDRLEEFYRSRNEPVRVETCPLADPTFIEQFGQRGYRVTEFSNVMARQVSPDEACPEPPEGVTIEKIGKDRIDVWTMTVSQGFADKFPVSQELLEVMKLFAFGPKTECYLASVDGKIAGGGTLALHDGVAGLFGASTLPVARKRGVQTALLQRRLARASQAGSDLAVSIAQPGSVSQRNILQQGERSRSRETRHPLPCVDRDQDRSLLLTRSVLERYYNARGLSTDRAKSSDCPWHSGSEVC